MDGSQDPFRATTALIVELSMAYVCLQAGFKLGLPDERSLLPATGRVLVQWIPLMCGIVLGLASVAVAASPLPSSPAGAAADSPRPTGTRPQSLDGFLERQTGADGYLGAVSLVWRDGKVVQSSAYGYRDLARAQPMREDSIFRIYSMTKTVTTVAVLMLVEEGKLSLDDPVGEYLPGFDRLQVFTGGSADHPRLRAARSPLTVEQLLTHTAGFATAAGEEATKLLERADLHGSDDLAEFSARLDKVPLAVEPGTRFRYDGTQMEVAARLVEVRSGQSFDAFLRQRIFTPLRMADTGFEVPAADRARVVDLTVMGEDGKLRLDAGPSAVRPGVMLNPYTSGAGGLYSTAPDFLRFCRMLLEGGSLDGATLLRSDTVADMMVNHLTFLDPPVTQFSDAEGFGLGGSVLLDPARKGRLGAGGQFGWSGAASTYFSIDPQAKMISILLLQHLPNDAANDLPRLATPYYNLVHQAFAP